MERRKFIQTSALATSGAMLASQNAYAFNSILGKADKMEISPDWNGKTTPIKPTWGGLANVDQALWMLRADMQEQMKMYRDEIGMKHVRAVGIFNDSLFTYARKPELFFDKERVEKPYVNWRSPFQIFDMLLDMDINPVITTCFMPSELASGKRTVFMTKSNVTPPKDWKEWEKFLKSFIGALVDRYGVNIMKNWYFEAWNEPNLGAFWQGGKEGYWQLYKILHNVIKEFSSDFKIGGPSTARGEWFPEFFDFAQKEGVTIDYMIGHCYNNDSASGAALSPFEGPQGDKENNSPNFLKGVIKGMRKFMDDAGFKGEFHMNEWGPSWYPSRRERETPSEAAFVVKTMNEVSQVADYYSFWCISDIYNQLGYNDAEFIGHYGMLTYNGLRKQSYHAHQLLNKMGDEQVALNKVVNDQSTAMVTKSKEGVQVLAYNFKVDYKYGEATTAKPVEVMLPESINPDSIQLIKLDSIENNARKDWEDMGSPTYLKKQELEQLKVKNELYTSSEKVKVKKEDKGYKATFNLETPGVAYLSANY